MRSSWTSLSPGIPGYHQLPRHLSRMALLSLLYLCCLSLPRRWHPLGGSKRSRFWQLRKWSLSALPLPSGSDLTWDGLTIAPLQFPSAKHAKCSKGHFGKVPWVFFVFFFSREMSKSGQLTRSSLWPQEVILKKDAFAKTTFSNRLHLLPSKLWHLEILQGQCKRPGGGLLERKVIHKAKKGAKISSQLSADTTGFRLCSTQPSPAFSRTSYVTSPGRAKAQLSAQRCGAELKPPSRW